MNLPIAATSWMQVYKKAMSCFREMEIPKKVNDIDFEVTTGDSNIVEFRATIGEIKAACFDELIQALPDITELDCIIEVFDTTNQLLPITGINNLKELIR